MARTALPTRRTLLRFGAAGLTLPSLLRTQARAAPRTDGFGRAKRCLLLFLTGGAPQHDTFDPKPEAPSGIKGEFKPIATRVPGVRFGELFPLLADRTDKLCVVRSVTHPDTVHTSAGYTMLTGVPHPKANAKTATDIRPAPTDHPHLGALVAKLRPPASGPAFVALPEVIKDAGVNEFPGLGAGFLGQRYDPFRIDGDPKTGLFRLPDVELPDDVPHERLNDRRSLLSELDRGSTLPDRDAFNDRAFDLLRTPAVHRALKLDREPARAREAYGHHLFGRGCLLARRLLEANVPLVTVYWNYEGPEDSPVWDTHWNNFRHMRHRLAPPTDRAVSVLLDDLDVRGMLSDTLVVVMGEFGRSPRINLKAGRDHWPQVQSLLLAGAGVRSGTAFGSSDRIGAYPAEHPIGPADLTATVLHLLGVAPGGEVHDALGRPFKVCTGEPVRGLIGA